MTHTLTIVTRGPERPYVHDARDEGTRVGIIIERPSSVMRLDALLARTSGREGLHVALVDPSGRVIHHSSMLSRTEVETLTVGRHSHADLRDETSAFALRHALLVRRPERPEELFVFDCESADGCHDMTGSAVHAAKIDAPFALRVGANHLVAFTAEHAALGPHGLLELLALTLVRRNPPSAAASSFVYKLEDLSRPCVEPLDPAGPEVTGRSVALRPARPVAEVTFRPTPEALARGYLLGRYQRCGAPALATWETNMSRVHAILFSLGDASYIADLGSTNGTRHESAGFVRLKHLAANDVFWLGDTRLTVQG